MECTLIMMSLMPDLGVSFIIMHSTSRIVKDEVTGKKFASFPWSILSHGQGINVFIGFSDELFVIRLNTKSPIPVQFKCLPSEVPKFHERPPSRLLVGNLVALRLFRRPQRPPHNICSLAPLQVPKNQEDCPPSSLVHLLLFEN